ncbi:MAG TPA: molybdenum cofactor guanylyltransferase [Bacteroidales bacterium]|nr:molybdenum cofactor guanylyltransferase [Bacteroidales bacterium]
MKPPQGNYNISGIVLAGGENSRFKGITKANIVVDGRSILRNILDLVSPIFSETIIVANNLDGFSEYSDYRIVRDVFRKVGPLGGLHAGMKACSTEAVFLLACDMPSLSEDIIRYQIDLFFRSGCEILIPRIGQWDEPLHAIYSRAVYQRLDQFLGSTRKYAIRDFLQLAEVEYFNPEMKNFKRQVFTNINTPDDLASLKEGR